MGDIKENKLYLEAARQFGAAKKSIEIKNTVRYFEHCQFLEPLPKVGQR
jgi:hypothetical protein